LRSGGHLENCIVRIKKNAIFLRNQISKRRRREKAADGKEKNRTTIKIVARARPMETLG
jgi:hypothetical protein